MVVEVELARGPVIDSPSAPLLLQRPFPSPVPNTVQSAPLPKCLHSSPSPPPSVTRLSTSLPRASGRPSSSSLPPMDHSGPLRIRSATSSSWSTCYFILSCSKLYRFSSPDVSRTAHLRLIRFQLKPSLTSPLQHTAPLEILDISSHQLISDGPLPPTHRRTPSSSCQASSSSGSSGRPSASPSQPHGFRLIHRSSPAWILSTVQSGDDGQLEARAWRAALLRATSRGLSGERQVE